MMNNQVVTVIALVSLVISVISLLVGVLATAKMIGMEKSTHSVQLMPVDPEIDRLNQEYTKQATQDPWATSEAAVKKQGKMFKEDLEDNMPEFFEEEPEIISY